MGSTSRLPLSFEEVAKGSAEAFAYDYIGPSYIGSPVSAGDTGLLGKDIGLVALVEDIALAGTVVEPIGVDIGVSVRRRVSRSPIIGVNIVGGLKRVRVLKRLI